MQAIKKYYSNLEDGQKTVLKMFVLSYGLLFLFGCYLFLDNIFHLPPWPSGLGSMLFFVVPNVAVLIGLAWFVEFIFQ